MLCKPIGLGSPVPLSVLLYYWMCFRATVSVIWRVLAASSNGRRSEVASSSSLPLMSAWAIPCEWKIPPTASLAPLCGPNLGCREEKCASASALLISPSLWCGVGGKVYFFLYHPAAWLHARVRLHRFLCGSRPQHLSRLNNGHMTAQIRGWPACCEGF